MRTSSTGARRELRSSSEFLEVGAYENVTIEFGEPPNESQRLFPVAYRDADREMICDCPAPNRTMTGPTRDRTV